MIRLVLLSIALTFALAAPAAADAVTGLIAAGKAFVATKVGAALAQLALSTGLSLLAQKLRGKPKKPGLQNSFKTTGANEPATCVVGRMAVKGHQIYHGSSGDNLKWYSEVLELCDTVVDGLERIAIDGVYSTLGAMDQDYGLIIEAKNKDEDSYRGWIRFHDGTQTAADSFLVSRFGSNADRPWTTDHKLQGRAYAVLTYYEDRKRYPRGVPDLSFELRGRPMYDPRKDSTTGGSGVHRWTDPDTWEWTDNPVLIIYNIMRGLEAPNGQIWGGDCDPEDLPLDNWIAAMAIPSIDVNGRNKYTCGLQFAFTDEPKDVIADLLATCNGQMVERGGVWYIQVDAPETPVVSITDADVLVSEPLSADPFPGLEQTYNGVSITHPDPNSLWNAKPATTLSNAAWVAEDGTPRVFDLQLPAVFSTEQANQLGDAVLADNRRFRRHGQSLPPEYFWLRPLNTLAWTSAEEGYTSKLFELFEIAYDPITFNIQTSIRERDAGDFTIDPSLEVPSPPTAITPFPRPDIGVPDWDVEGITIDDANGPRLPALQMTWTADELVDTIHAIAYEVRVVSSGVVVLTGTTSDIEAERLVVSGGMLGGLDYEARPRPLSFSRETVWGDWVSDTLPAVFDQLRVVQLTASTQVFDYDAGGANPDPASATFTATAQGEVATPYFEFLVDGVSVQNGAQATYAYTPAASAGDMPEQVAVRLRDGATTGDVLATDVMTTIGLRQGSSALNAFLSNENVTLSADASGGSVSMAGSGTAVQVIFGSTKLTYDGVGTANGTYAVAASVIAGTITPGGISASGVDAAVANHSGFTSDTAIIRYTVTGKDGSGQSFSLTLDQVLSKAKAGAPGADGTSGSDGDDGTDGAAAIEMVVRPNAAVLPASSAGVVSSYANSGCEIEVHEANDRLNFTTSTSLGALTPGSWQITGTSVSPSGHLTVGAISDVASGASVANHSAMNSGTDTVQITFSIRFMRNDGSVGTRSVRQVITKAKNGADGADGNPGTAGASVLVVYADTGNASTNSQSLSAGSRQFVAYYEYTGSAPSLPIRSGITFVKFIGADGAAGQAVWPVYANDAAGNGQSFSPTGKNFVTFFEATSQPTLPVTGQTFVKYVGSDGADGADGADGSDGQDGARGPGEYFISVTSLTQADTSGEVNTRFTTAVGAPVHMDTATFYTGTLANPTDQVTWRYASGSWTQVIKRYKGSVIIDETLFVQALVLDGTKFEPGAGNSLSTVDGGFAEIDYDQNLTGATAFTLNSWTLVDTLQFTNDAEGGMAVWWNCICEATGTTGTDYTNYVEFDLRTVVSQSGGGVTYTKEWAGLRLTPYQTMPFSRIIPAAELNGRNTNPINVAVSVRITSRNPSSFNVKVRDVQGLSLEAKT